MYTRPKKTFSYYLDTEFNARFVGRGLFRRPVYTIDLISVGIIGDDGRELYMVSKEFDLRSAWNVWQPKKKNFSMAVMQSNGTKEEKTAYMKNFQKLEKEYWLRENVLKRIFLELAAKNDGEYIGYTFTYNLFKELISTYGYTNKEIAKGVEAFVDAPAHATESCLPDSKNVLGNPVTAIADMRNIFYGYYADYDWVLLCSLFGGMMSLPEGFPMYCKDLKQMQDSAAGLFTRSFRERDSFDSTSLEGGLKIMKEHNGFPKQENKHNALDDAKWNKRLHEFLQGVYLSNRLKGLGW